MFCSVWSSRTNRSRPAQQNVAVRKAADTGYSLLLNLVVLCEFAWVLRRSYGYSKAEIADCIEQFLGNSPALIFQD